MALLLGFSSQATSVTIITHPSVKEQTLTPAQLRRIFTMRQTRWQNNLPIVVFTLPSKHSVHQRFAKESLKLFPYQLDMIWNKLTFSGLGVAPQKIKTQTQLLQAVQATPGAIGYVESGKEADDVLVIRIKK